MQNSQHPTVSVYIECLLSRILCVRCLPNEPAHCFTLKTVCIRRTPTVTQYYCEVCGVFATSKEQLVMHNEGKKHKRTVALKELTEGHLPTGSPDADAQAPQTGELASYWHVCRMTGLTTATIYSDLSYSTSNSVQVCLGHLPKGKVNADAQALQTGELASYWHVCRTTGLTTAAIYSDLSYCTANPVPALPSKVICSYSIATHGGVDILRTVMRKAVGVHSFTAKVSSDEPFWLMRRHLSWTVHLKHPSKFTEATTFNMHASSVPEAQMGTCACAGLVLSLTEFVKNSICNLGVPAALKKISRHACLSRLCISQHSLGQVGLHLVYLGVVGNGFAC